MGHCISMAGQFQIYPRSGRGYPLCGVRLISSIMIDHLAIIVDCYCENQVVIIVLVSGIMMG